MAQTHLKLAVIVRSRTPVSRWASRGFTPFAVGLDPPAVAAGARMGPAGEDELWYAGLRDLALHSGDTAHYRDNLASTRPAVWVALRRGALDVAGLTADPYEGEALAGDDGLTVEAVDMPEPVADVLRGFVALHHVEHAFEKRARKRADPEAMGRRAPGARR